jgi:hypothetical protein
VNCNLFFALELFLFLSDFSDGSSDDNAQRSFPETVGSLATRQREHALQLSQTSQGTSSWTGLTIEDLKNKKLFDYYDVN